MKNLIIIGAGGFAREMYWHAQNSRGFNVDWQIKGFLDGDVKLSPEDYAKLPANVPVLGDVNNYEICADDVFTCAIGTPKIRRKLIEIMLNRGAEFINIIGNESFIAPTAKIGRGVILALRVIINDNAELGDFSLMHDISGLGHDSKVGSYCCLMNNVNVTGGAVVGDEVFMASGAFIAPKAKVEDGAHIGPNSVVLKRVKAGAKVIGNPAVEF